MGIKTVKIFQKPLTKEDYEGEAFVRDTDTKGTDTMYRDNGDELRYCRVYFSDAPKVAYYRWVCFND